jgi:hypothetical protein
MKQRVVMSMFALIALCFAGPPATADDEGDRKPGAPVSYQASRFDISAPLIDMALTSQDTRSFVVEHREPVVPEGINRLPDGWNGTVGVRHSPHVHQTEAGTRGTVPAPTVNAQGLGRGFTNYSISGSPPDPTGAPGLEHYVQWVNVHYAFFNKDGSVVDLVGNDFVSGNALWSGFGGACESDNDGDPIVLYDQLADRWMLSQFAVASGGGTGPFYQCLAVSQTSDPLGSWYRYEYVWPNNLFNDYPKFGLWPDGYYLTVNQFTGNDAWRGAGVAVFEREKMIAGNPSAGIQYWDLGTGWGSLVPSDLDGSTEPPQGSPAYLFTASNGVTDYINIWEVSMDWDTPGNSTCGDGSNDPNSSVVVTSFVTSQGITQPGGATLDTLSYRLMHRAPYRNFGTHESIVLSHAVMNPTLMRWYEIRDPGGTPVLHQEGSYQPDTTERWMGTIAMDRMGNMMMGYSASDDTVSPSIRMAGRLADDPLGTLPVGEIEVMTGSGYQRNVDRWGDYTTMAIDPVDDCTFWFTGQYTDNVGIFNWRTRVVAIRFPNCEAGQLFADGFESGETNLWSDVVGGF